MAKASYVQTSFLGGEWSQTALGDFADPKYKTAMQVCLNGIPVESGGVNRRPASEFLAPTYGGLAGRVINFDIKESSPFAMEFTNRNIRIFDKNSLVYDEADLTVTAISTANPAVVETTAANDFQSGDQVQFSALGTYDPLLDNRQFSITVIDTTHFSLQDSVTGDNIDGSTLATFTTGNVNHILVMGSPYLDGLFQDMRSVQAETTAVLLHNQIKPTLIMAKLPDATNGETAVTFSMSPAQFFDGPYNDAITQATVTPASTSGIVGLTIASPTYSSTTPYNIGDFVVYSSQAYKSLIATNLGNEPDTSSFAWEAVDQDTVVGPDGLQQSDIGRHIRLLSEPAAWNISTTYTANTAVKYKNAYWTSVISSNTGNTPGLDISKWAPTPSAAQWTWGKITSLSGATSTLIPYVSGTIFTVAGVLPNNTLGQENQAFTGNTSKIKRNCAFKQTAALTRTVVGKHFGSGQTISFVNVYGPNNSGFVDASSFSLAISINLRGSATAPTTPDDGTLLGSSGNVDGTVPGMQVQVFSNDTTTAWKYIWVEMIVTNGSVTGWYIAEADMFTTAAFSGTGISVQIIGPALLYTTAITTWRLGTYSDQYGWPSCGTYHEGRLWLSGQTDNRVDGSALCDINGNPQDSLFYFTPTLADLTVTDACGISYNLEGPDVNAIFWMEPDQQGIICGTQAGEWLIQATNINAPLTPTSMQAHRVTKIGCADIEPRRTDHTLLVVQRYTRSIVEYFADVFSGKFSAPDLCTKAKHLMAPNVAEIAYQQVLTPILWARMADGSLRGMSYKRDTLMSSQGPTFNGWHQHMLGSGRDIESLTMGSDTTGLLQTPWFVTNDATTNVRHVERLGTLFQETDKLVDANFVDNGVKASSYSVTTSGGNSGVTFTGFFHLAGKTVSVFAGGLDLGDWTVASNGTIFVPFYPAGGQKNALYTSAFVATFSGAMPAVAGFTFTTQGQLVDPIDPGQDGARNGPGFGKIKRTNKVLAKLVNTVGIYFGTDRAKWNLAKLATKGMTKLAQNVMFTGVYKDNVQDAAEGMESAVAFQITRPYPATVANLGGMIETVDE